MRPWIGAIALLILLPGCGPKFDERHLDGIDLSGATVAEFRKKYGPEDERNPLYVLGVPVFHRLKFRLTHDDAKRFTTAPSGPIFVDEGSSHNAIRVWLPLPKAPRSYEDAKNQWGDPKHNSIIQPSQAATLPVNLVGLNYAEFEVNDMEVGLFYDGESSRIAMMTWSPLLKDEDPSQNKEKKATEGSESSDEGS